jgi:hypothetical protein
MREILQDVGQVTAATTTIIGSAIKLVNGTNNLALQLLLSLVIATCAGIIASTAVKRGFLSR